MQSYTIQTNSGTKTDHDRVRRDLRYHFMNPKNKWRAKGTPPIKLILVVVKLIFVTIQIVIFSKNNSDEVAFYEGSKISFKHLFLLNWESNMETLPYPPSTGPFSIYKVEDFYSALNYALNTYYNLEDQAVGPYSFTKDNIPIMVLCVTYYRFEDLFPFNHTYKFIAQTVKNCTELKPIPMNCTSQIYDSKKYLNGKNFTINFSKLLMADLSFSLRNIRLRSEDRIPKPECLQFDISIFFDNSNHDGQMIISLEADMLSFNCIESEHNITVSVMSENMLLALDVIGLIFSCISLILSTRSLVRINKFWRTTKSFFFMEMEIDISDKWVHFCGIQYIVIFVGDILVIVGTILKIEIYTLDRRDIHRFTICNYFLGLGLFIGHLTLVRYFSYFPRSSILVNTIRLAMPPLMRFSLCSILLYLAFCLLGWIVLGPHHIKFRTLDTSVACLFSLMLGDETFITLSAVARKNTFIYIFSQIFIYIFSILFIFVVLNLILTIIYEAYEEAEKQETFGCDSDPFWDFINADTDSCNSDMYKDDVIHDNTLTKLRNKYLLHKCLDIFCCCIGKDNHNIEIRIDDLTDNEDIDMPSFRSHNSRISLKSGSDMLNRFLRRSQRGKISNYSSILNRNRKRTPQINIITEEIVRQRERGFSY